MPGQYSYAAACLRLLIAVLYSTSATRLYFKNNVIYRRLYYHFVITPPPPPPPRPLPPPPPTASPSPVLHREESQHSQTHHSCGITDTHSLRKQPAWATRATTDFISGDIDYISCCNTECEWRNGDGAGGGGGGGGGAGERRGSSWR